MPFALRATLPPTKVIDLATRYLAVAGPLGRAAFRVR